MTKINYQALREAAEKATKGKWAVEFDDEIYSTDGINHEQIAMVFSENESRDAEFIAAANPATVLALLDELETAKKRIAELKAEPVSQTYKLNQLSGNSPVTTDGWVMVPKELTPEMMRAVQIRSELGGYATSNLSGAYNMFSEFWNVAVSAAPKVDDL
ncbi:ead/Ea22-like family protein [Escherichia coli]|nr:ead/Ea22-like family protein [Escherichia coli]